LYGGKTIIKELEILPLLSLEIEEPGNTKGSLGKLSKKKKIMVKVGQKNKEVTVRVVKVGLKVTDPKTGVEYIHRLKPTEYIPAVIPKIPIKARLIKKTNGA